MLTVQYAYSNSQKKYYATWEYTENSMSLTLSRENSFHFIQQNILDIQITNYNLSSVIN